MEGSGTALAAAAGTLACQLIANAFRSCEATSPLAVKSPPLQVLGDSRQLSAGAFRSYALTVPSRFESPLKYAVLPNS